MKLHYSLVFSLPAVLQILVLPTEATGCSTINPATSALIKEYEGFAQNPKSDSDGQYTIGYGHICEEDDCSDITSTLPLTEKDAEELLEKDIVPAAECLDSSIDSSVTLNKNQWGALVSWAYDVGCESVSSSTLVSQLNDGQDPNDVAMKELPNWNKKDGKVLPHLTLRRNAELRLFQVESTSEAFPECS
ncbi:hypothetical protein H4R24_002540 [Coemansia sp. RSA 988]|nr:hypothetical protein H4R24_002540 [Coemansia sp. RSA 988]